MTRIGVLIHMGDDTPIESHTLTSAAATPPEVLTIGENSSSDGIGIFINSRAQAEKLFDEVAELTMRWRERDPQVITVAAVIAAEDDSVAEHQRREHDGGLASADCIICASLGWLDEGFDETALLDPRVVAIVNARRADRDPVEVYGTPEHEQWLIEQEGREP